MARTDLPTEPFTLFGEWFAEAQAREVCDANAMSLATATPDAKPSVRIVLLKDWDERGFVFYTNYESRKGQEMLANPQVSLNFHWKSLRRQVRIEGRVIQVESSEADAYFASRPRDAQLGAWASEQSRPLRDRDTFQRRLAAFAARFDGRPVTRPPHWSGFRVVPQVVEFWLDREFRLHDRLVFQREGEQWTTILLYP